MLEICCRNIVQDCRNPRHRLTATDACSVVGLEMLSDRLVSITLGQTCVDHDLRTFMAQAVRHAACRLVDLECIQDYQEVSLKFDHFFAQAERQAACRMVDLESRTGSVLEI